jgi:hypothetical protein
MENLDEAKQKIAELERARLLDKLSVDNGADRYALDSFLPSDLQLGENGKIATENGEQSLEEYLDSHPTLSKVKGSLLPDDTSGKTAKSEGEPTSGQAVPKFSTPKGAPASKSPTNDIAAIYRETQAQRLKQINQRYGVE